MQFPIIYHFGKESQDRQSCSVRNISDKLYSIHHFVGVARH